MTGEKDQQLAGLKAVREPFAADWVSKLPKPTKRENPKGNCRECGKYHGLPAVHIDYVGHADITARLLDVDPLWNWEPLSITDDGLPKISVKDNTASMWIKLTICGVTRLGVGTAPANKEEVQKELIGDALRNAAMRFGVALDLWSKADRSNATEEAAEASPVAVETVSLVGYIKSELNANERDLLKVEWKRTFDFTTAVVPKALEQKCLTMIDSFAGKMPDMDKPAASDEATIDLSELVTHLSQAQRVQLKAGWSYSYPIEAVPKGDDEVEIRDLINFIQGGGAK